MFVTERTEQALPKRLLPAGLPGPGTKLSDLGLKADASRRIQEPGLARFLQFAQHRATLAAQIFGQDTG